MPGEIAQRVRAGDLRPDVALECSLCGLCTELCPERLDLVGMFLGLRRLAAAQGLVDLRRYRAILGYERRGASRTFSWYGLPTGCDTVLFPGCTLPGTRPEATYRLFEHLRRDIPDLGVVLDCCTKPSHDLGLQDHFLAMFGEMRGWLLHHGVRRVLVACPNCYKVFSTYGQGLAVSTVWEHLAERGMPESPEGGPLPAGQVTVHDPCPLRREPGIHAAARALIRARGLEVAEMRHKGRKTFCCGEGGSVVVAAPELARRWTRRRAHEAGARPVMTYCAGCVGFLGGEVDAVHLLDLAFSPLAALAGRARVARTPFTYLNRLRLKRRLRKRLNTAKSRVRSFRPGRADAG
jgi:Fe-S oxidoreductase